MRHKYRETKRISKLLKELDALKIIFDNYPLRPQIEENFLRKSILKSSLYSARVEGNKTVIEEAEYLSFGPRSKSLKKIEIFNLLKAYRLVRSGRIPKKLSLLYTKKLHRIVMGGISGNAGFFRQEPWGIFNQAGIAVYLAPAHFKVPKLMKDFIASVNSMKYHPAVKGAVAQFVFERIHPFADGNGRVGRLITVSIMGVNGYGFRGLIPFEEYIDENRDLYYASLEGSNDTTRLVEYLLNGMVIQAKRVLEDFKNIHEEKKEYKLSSRRREILQIIKDHPYSSFDFIRRRFSSVGEDVLHYDLKKLQIEGFISKTGVSRGVTYFAKSE